MELSEQAKAIIKMLGNEPRFSDAALKRVLALAAAAPNQSQLSVELLAVASRMYENGFADASAQLAALAMHVMGSEKAGARAQKLMHDAKEPSPTKKAQAAALAPKARKKPR